VSDRTHSALGPPPEILFRRRIHAISAGLELWRAKELVRTLAERALRARYKQAVLGFAWAIITPLVMMVVLTIFFQRVADVKTGGAPYSLFSYLGLLPWTFFSASLSQGGLSLVQNMSLVNKVYCPREVFPISDVVVAGVDTTIAVGTLCVLFLVTGFMPKATSVWVPVLLPVLLAFTLGVTILLSAFIVYFRDLRHMLPIVLQLGLFATPVAYGMDAIPKDLQIPYSVLNPIAPVIDGLRRTVLYGQQPAWDLLAAGAATSVIWLVVGYVLFKRLETGIADVA
jgi:ABC-type polysaccharide/polyol phosphate export permease